MRVLVFLVLFLAGRAQAETPPVQVGEELPPAAPACTARFWEPPAGAFAEDTTGTSGERFFLDSVPFGAQVLVEGRSIGATPLWVDARAVEGRTLWISLPGYRKEQVDLTSAEGGVVEVRLRPAGSLANELCPGQGEPGSLVQEGWFKWGLFLVGTGSAAAGLHFKERADDAYDEYLHTGNAARMRDAFKRAERYDRYALGCWVAAEVSLVSFLYLLMRPPAPADRSWDVSLDGSGDRCGISVRCEF